MKGLGLLLVIQLCFLAVQGLFLKQGSVTLAKSRYNPLQPAKNNQRKVVPEYILQFFRENIKYGRNVNLYCISPKIVRTKRAIKLIFKNGSFMDDKSWKWKRDELRMFMTTPTKKSIMSSKKPYYVKVFDLHSRRIVDMFPFSSSYQGWKTLNISHWRMMKPVQDSRGKFGLKIVVIQDRRKLNIKRTAFRKLRNKYAPYFIEFFQVKNQEETLKSTSKSWLKIDLQREENALPKSTRPASVKRDYYLPFQRYLTGRAV
ncbi:uncharacterized protein LOC114523167 [Dendronephthya gigantea]|uniref:uncharacterized protein LOC114523167 n=1 Tax=Dendronephthya gigantea TaxID=151771 RepID=UPI00106DCAFA|nr:uncharacterized protein LOC114523167 [Dendronephthya gigantea]